MSEHGGLALFHPLVQKWFRERLGTPTDVQEAAWPAIAAGEHVLATAPTGSGKTLTAFLWAIDQLVTGAWPVGHTSVLYVSPLRALNNDIRRNLTAPLSELRAEFEAVGEPFPNIRAMTRSGDTPQSERRRMLSRPPEILITTPESLNILHSSLGGQSILTGIRTVILDEIHAVIGTKRGTHLITAVDRLVPACGEFQRIALSATVRPLEKVAEFIGGYRREGRSGAEPHYAPRAVSILRSGAAKVYDVSVRFPEEATRIEQGDSVWDPLVEEFREIIDRHQSTLLFANSRRLCEKLTLLINSGYDRPVAYAHHGSLSRKLREEIEGKLKDGVLKAIVATNSLELGIDIGALDAVILVQSPPSVSSAIQRLGRAGHQGWRGQPWCPLPDIPTRFDRGRRAVGGDSTAGHRGD
jgi:ATP-dependent Lhr-like helicase